MHDRSYFVYIMTNPGHSVLYTGVTNNLSRRVWEHQQRRVDGFTKKYNVVLLMYYEEYPDPVSAIAREKQLKGGPRRQKLELINQMNPAWDDLYETL